jgi:hypothetical protein
MATNGLQKHREKRIDERKNADGSGKSESDVPCVRAVRCCECISTNVPKVRTSKTKPVSVRRPLGGAAEGMGCGACPENYRSKNLRVSSWLACDAVVSIIFEL